MIRNIPTQLYFSTGTFLILILSVSIYNFWRAPPSAGHRKKLLISIVVFGVGMTLEGLAYIGLAGTFSIVPEILILAGLALFIYTSLNVRRSLRDKGFGKERKMKIRKKRGGGGVISLDVLRGLSGQRIHTRAGPDRPRDMDGHLLDLHR